MGGYHHTFGIRKNGACVATFCSFEKEAFAKGCQWHVHKGRLQSTHGSELRKVIVKVCRDRTESHKTCEAEMGKWDFLEKVLRNCPDQKGFELSRTYKAEVDEPCTKCFSAFSKKCDLAVEEGTPVIIQDRVEHGIHTFMDLDTFEAEDVGRSLQCYPLCFSLAQASYRVSGGSNVITEIRGVKLSAESGSSSGSGPCCILLTSVTVHSEAREFGWKDRGSAGIEAFREVERKLCYIAAPPAAPRRRKPSAPPLEDEEQLEDGDGIAWRPETTSCSGTTLEPRSFMQDDSKQFVSPFTEQYGLPIQQQQYTLPQPTSPLGELPALHAQTMEQMFSKDKAHSSPKQFSPRSVCPSQELIWGKKLQQSTHYRFSASPQEGCPTMQHMFSMHNAPHMQELHSLPADPTKLKMIHSKPGEQTSPTFMDGDFGMPPTYESVVLGTEGQGFPPPYSETCRDSAFPFD